MKKQLILILLTYAEIFALDCVTELRIFVNNATLLYDVPTHLEETTKNKIHTLYDFYMKKGSNPDTSVTLGYATSGGSGLIVRKKFFTAAIPDLTKDLKYVCSHPN